MAFNAEIAAKAADKRLDQIERKLEQLASKSNDNSDFVATKKAHADRLTAIENRLAAVEKLAKVLGESRGDSKLVALEKVVAVMRDNTAAEHSRESNVLKGLEQTQVRHVDLLRKLNEQIAAQEKKSGSLKDQLVALEAKLVDSEKRKVDKTRADAESLVAAERAQREKQSQQEQDRLRSITQKVQQDAERYADAQIKALLAARVDTLDKLVATAMAQIGAIAKR